jgi:hypothetical protein
MVLCEKCGSIQIEKAPRAAFDILIAYVSTRRPFLCLRCGWRGRRDWTDEEIRERPGCGPSGAVADPAMSALDGAPPAPVMLDSAAPDFGTQLDKATQAMDALPVAQPTFAAPMSRGAQRPIRRRRHPRRREIVNTTVVTVGILSIFGLLLLMRNCASGIEGF